MEFPTLDRLHILLQKDKAFRDYFNTFLNLPVFCRRFTYDAEIEKFGVDPSPSHSVADGVLLSWIYNQRLPLFWSSQLYLEYSLCLEITKNNSCISCSDCGLLTGVVEMNQFRQFLSGTEGESACLFWLDVQHLVHVLHRNTTQCDAGCVGGFIDQIRREYVNDNAPFRLRHDIRRKLTSQFCQLTTSTACPDLNQHSGLSNTHSRYIQTIRIAQTQVITSLKEYWCSKYIDAVKNSKLSLINITPSSMDCSDPTSTVNRTNVSIGLPNIVTDEGSKYHNKPSTTQSCVKLPTIAMANTCSPRRLRTKGMLNVMPLFSPSTNNLFPHSDVPFKSRMEGEFFHLDPFLSGSLRADVLAGNPFLSYLSNCRDNEAINYLLFWQSAELLFMQDEMRRWYQSRKGDQKWRGLQQGDKECPYISYNNKFHLHAKTPTELVELYLTKGSPHMIEMPDDTRKELSLLLPKGLGQSLLISVQEFAAQQLLCPWKEFLSNDNHEFIKHCTTEGVLPPDVQEEHLSFPEASLSPTEVVQHTFGSSHLKGMWRALRLAESAQYPGTSTLPSRRQTDVTLTGGMESLEDDSVSREEGSKDISMRDLTGISLNQMVTTVHHTMKRDEKRSLHTILSITKPTRSLQNDAKKKKVIPATLREILKDADQMEQFYKFLVAQGGGCEVQLLFWLAVEDLKSCISNAKVYSRKMKRIIKKFFKSTETNRVFQCPDALASCLSGLQNANPLQILAAQSAVVEVMERHWYSRYIASLTIEEKKNEKETGEEDEQKQTKKAHICVEHTKDLWRMFAQGVISFRRGLMNPDTAEDFKSYLREEVVKGSSGSHRKVVGTKVVYVTKLLNDLSFWAEVERYKDMADIVRATKQGKIHTPEDDIMVHKKAHAIINCFIDSAVMPRVQINIPNELVQYILDCVSQGEISRGLFHEAALNIFSVLILYWRRYLMIRHTRKKKESEVVSTHTHHNPPPHTHRAHNLQKVASFDIFHPDNHILLDVGPVLSFSLSEGLHWVNPSHRHHFEFATVKQISSHHHPKLHKHSSHRSHNSKKHNIQHLDSFHQPHYSHKSMKQHYSHKSMKHTPEQLTLPVIHS